MAGLRQQPQGAQAPRDPVAQDETLQTLPGSGGTRAPRAPRAPSCRMLNGEDYIESAEWRQSDRANATRKWLRCELIVLEQMLLASGMSTEEAIENRAEWRQSDPIVGPPSPRYLRHKRAFVQMPWPYETPRASSPPTTSRASSSFEPPPPATTRASSSNEPPPPATPRAWSESPPPASPLLPLALSESPPRRKARHTS